MFKRFTQLCRDLSPEGLRLRRLVWKMDQHPEMFDPQKIVLNTNDQPVRQYRQEGHAPSHTYRHPETGARHRR